MIERAKWRVSAGSSLRTRLSSKIPHVAWIRDMADPTNEWTDGAWNPVAGCTVLTAGCTNCYAMRMAARLAAMGTEKYQTLTRKSGRRYVWTGKIRCDDKSLNIP